MNPTGAIQGQSRYKVSVPTEVSAVKEDANSKVQTANKELNETANLASLVTNPGWAVLEARILKDIELYKSGANLVELVAANKTDDEIGKALKTEMKVAARLDSYIQLVHTAYRVQEEEKEARRSAIRSQRA